MTVKLKLTGLETFSSPACRIRGVSATVRKGEVALFSQGVADLLVKGGRHSGPENVWVSNWTVVDDEEKATYDFSDLQPPQRRLSRMEELAQANKARQSGESTPSSEGSTPPAGEQDKDPEDPDSTTNQQSGESSTETETGTDTVDTPHATKALAPQRPAAAKRAAPVKRGKTAA